MDAGAGIGRIVTRMLVARFVGLIGSPSGRLDAESAKRMGI